MNKLTSINPEKFRSTCCALFTVTIIISTTLQFPGTEYIQHGIFYPYPFYLLQENTKTMFRILRNNLKVWNPMEWSTKLMVSELATASAKAAVGAFAFPISSSISESLSSNSNSQFPSEFFFSLPDATWNTQFTKITSTKDAKTLFLEKLTTVYVSKSNKPLSCEKQELFGANNPLANNNQLLGGLLTILFRGLYKKKSVGSLSQ